MNNSAWQKDGVCAVETSLERKEGVLLMRLLDARRGSLPLNLGHGEPSKVLELRSYTRGEEQGDAHTSSQKGLSAGPSGSHPLCSLLGPPPIPSTRLYLSLWGGYRCRRPCFPLCCVSPGQPLSASEHLFLEPFDNCPRV